MKETTHEKIARLEPSDTHGPTIAWDKGTPKYRLSVKKRTYYIRNLTTWCEFYEVNYQMLLRAIRESDGVYKDISVLEL